MAPMLSRWAVWAASAAAAGDVGSIGGACGVDAELGVTVLWNSNTIVPEDVDVGPVESSMAVGGIVALEGPAVMEEKGAARVKTSVRLLQQVPRFRPASQHRWNPAVPPLGSHTLTKAVSGSA